MFYVDDNDDDDGHNDCGEQSTMLYQVLMKL